MFEFEEICRCSPLKSVDVSRVVVALAAASSRAPARAEECLTDWGQAGEIVRREKLMTVQQLTQSNAAGLPGQIVKTTLCKDGDDYIYKVVVRRRQGPAEDACG